MIATTTTTTTPPTDERVPAVTAGRDLTIDLLRALSILAVVVGHWLVVVPSYRDGRFDGVNALATVPLMQQLTWIFQVMPLFFVVGGFANGISWRTARRKGTAYADWLRVRLVRLAVPSAVMFTVAASAALGARLLGVDPELVQTLAWLVVVPVWFLAVYVVVVVLAPAMLAAHERFGIVAPIVLAALATGVDAVRFATGMTGAGAVVAATNFFWVFLFAQQLGFFWLDGRLDRRPWQPWALFAGGLIALVLLTHVGPYPVSLVGVPGEATANNAPPTITLIALGLAQAGLGLLGKRRIEGWLERPRVAGAVIGANLHAMTILLWHFTALVLAALVVLPLGLVPTYDAGTAPWWAVRVALLAVQAVPLAGLVWLFGRVERRGLVGPKPRSVRAVLAPAPAGRGARAARVVPGALLCAAAFSVITVRGLSDPATPLGLPLVGFGLFGAGLALARAPQRDRDVS